MTITRICSGICARGIAGCAAVFCLLASTSLAIPNIESDGRLGSWRDFLRSLGFTDSGLQVTAGDCVYLDTDKLAAGLITNSAGNSAMDFFKFPRTELRQNVGRTVAQENGPDIVVYDFTEILISPGLVSMPYTLVLFGKRPAAIVCQGMIGAYNGWAQSKEETFLGADFVVIAENSCDPDNPLDSQWVGSSRGGDGTWRSYTSSNGVTHYEVSKGGGGGYGGNGAPGADGNLYGLTVPGGAGGPPSFSWSVLQPGSPGGDEGYVNGLGGAHGGPGGGAVLIKSPKTIALSEVRAQGFVGELNGGRGSGGHVIIDTPELLKFRFIRINGPDDGGDGVVEFRSAPVIAGPGDGSPPCVFGRGIYEAAAGRGYVGVPQGVAFPDTGYSGDANLSYYNIASRPDSCPPVITINGSTIRNIDEGSSWVDDGASALDNASGSCPVATSGSVNTSIPGAYEVTYSATDSNGNTASKKRCVNVLPAQPASRDPQTGLPRLIAAMLRPVNPTSSAVDSRLLPTFRLATVEGQSYPSVTFLRRVHDYSPIGSYPELDPRLCMAGAGLSYTFHSSTSLASWAFYSFLSDFLSGFTFVQRANSRDGVVAPQGWEFATYRYNTPASSAPRFYRVAVSADAVN